MPEDTFRYKVELDSQGLAAHLASVRDIVNQGLVQAGRGVLGGAEAVGMATSRLSSDLLMGQQLIASAVPAQFMAMGPIGIAGTTLANVPGMPQTMGQEIMAAVGITRPPVGVFPSQFAALARPRLGERAPPAAL